MKIFSLFSKSNRVRTPTVIQMEAVECGAASLGIILAYYKRYVTLEELRIACGVSRDGSTVFNMKRAAKDYGLEAKAYRKSIEELRELDPPFVIFWNYNHFLVVEGFGKDVVYLNDPGVGPRTVTLEEFEKQYSEIVITFEVTEDFVPGGLAPSIWPGVVERLRKVKSPILYLIFAGFCLMLTNILSPGLTKIFFDVILGQEIFTWSNWYIAGFLALCAVMCAIIWLQQYILIRLNGKLSIRFSADYLAHILKLPLSFYQQRFGGEIAFRLSLNDSVIDILTGKLATTFVSAIFIITYALLMFGFNATIAMVAILSAGLNFLAVALIQRFRNDAYAKLQQDYGKYYGFAIGGLYYIESIKATGVEGDFFSRLLGYFNRALNTEQKLAKRNSYIMTLPVFLQMLTTAALFGIGGWMIMTENFTIGLFMALQMLINNFNTPVLQMSQLGEYVQTAKIDMARIDDVMKNPVDQMFQNAPVATQGYRRLSGEIELRNVTFGYSLLDPPLIENFSFVLKPGQRIALVGPTGCGKTTIARLISGLFTPWSGEILLDGIDKRQISREEIIASLATVDQDIFIFAGSIRDNITLFDKSFSDDEIIYAAKSAALHEEILQKSEGYEYILTEGGTNLSGGQRQRLEIARSFLLNPAILILDEATSALDTHTEEKIIKNVRQRGCTSIMVAHRLSTIRDCDEIVVLKDGKIIQRGTHDALKEQEGPYRELVLHEV
ncbi:MAG: NHLP family bacteriocin export ABC transporter peptidase/permease/ATPase subunit [Chlamydiales bacterium]